MSFNGHDLGFLRSIAAIKYIAVGATYPQNFHSVARIFIPDGTALYDHFGLHFTQVLLKWTVFLPIALLQACVGKTVTNIGDLISDAS